MSARGALRLHLLVVGKARAPLDAPAREYERRVDELVGLRVHEVTAERGGAGGRAEAKRLRARLPDRAWRVALDPAGKVPGDSAAFSRWLARRLEEPRPTALLIGGAGGLDPELAAEAEERLSLGPLTLPHQLARVVLAEQLYRGACLLRGHPYPR